MLEQIKKIIIIVGCQRSGTTLLGQMIAAPKNTVLLDESDGLYEWFDLFIANDPDASKVLSRVLGKARDKYQTASQRIITDQDNNSVLAPKIQYLVLKAPNLTYRYSDIAKLECPTCIIYAVRDSRAVVASMMALKHIDFTGNQLELLRQDPALNKEFYAETMLMVRKDQQPHVNNALLWNIKSSLYDRFVDQGLATALCQYEELIEDAESTCKKIAESINIPFDKLMLSHPLVYQGTAQGKTNRNRPVDKQSINKWTSSLNKHQIQQILTVTEKTMKKLGYSTNTDTAKTKASSIFCILGMHRSGTSCLTGCLQDCGLSLGEVVNKAPFNKKGNKESLTLRAINNQVLSLSGGAWDHPPEQLYWDDQSRSSRDLFISIHLQFSQWGFKDPRTVLTLPFWLEAIPDLKFIGTFRHPMAVARSHEHRDGLAIETGLEIWKQYNLKLIEYLDLYKFPLVCFDWPADVYMQTTLNIARTFGLKQISEKQSIPFYEQRLRQQTNDNTGPSLPNDILAIYKSLCTRAEHFRVSNQQTLLKLPTCS